LGCSWRILKEESVENDNIARETIENDSSFLGFIIFGNKLKPKSSEVIETLKKAKIEVKMLTGNLNFGINCFFYFFLLINRG
jgi:P-type E1-E2 ATPase